MELDNEIDLAEEADSIQENIMDMTFGERLKNHAVATAIFAGAFVLPCFIAAKVLK
jgi:ABC-type enterochelin transport system permease subunit